jgi:osmotically-inducible protein OsmY
LNLRFVRMKSLLKIGLCVGVLGLVGCRSASRSNSPAQDTKEFVSDLPEVKPGVVTSNASLGREISEALSREPKLQGSSIGVSISNLNGSVTLTGKVEQAAQEKLALQIAEKLAKKKTKDAKIISQLNIQGPKASGKAKSKIKSKN